MSALELYWILKLDSILNLVTFATVILGIIIICTYLALIISAGTYDNEKIRSWKDKYIKKLFIGFFICSTILIFTPNTTDIIMLKTIPKITNNEKIQQMPEKLIEIVDKQLDKYLGKNKEGGK